MLWDTAGQEEFDAITKAYYRGAQACVLAFSSTDRDSFDAASTWKMKVSPTDADYTDIWQVLSPSICWTSTWPQLFQSWGRACATEELQVDKPRPRELAL